MKCYEIDLSKLLKVTRLNKVTYTPARAHVTRIIEEYIIYIVKSGELCLLQNGEELILGPGDVYFFNIGEDQKPFKNTDCEFYYIHFLNDGVEECEINEDEYSRLIWQRKADFLRADIFGSESYEHIKAILPQKMHIDDTSQLESLLGFFKNNKIIYGYNSPAWRLNVSHEVSGFIMRLEELYFNIINKSTSRKSESVYNNVKRIVEYIEEHFKESFGSANIESDLLINFDYANRIFKKHLGCSIIKYRNRLRINTAKTLLGSKNMQDIAFELGFSNRYYFSRCFKKYEGISPEEYRENITKRQKAVDKND